MQSLSAAAIRTKGSTASRISTGTVSSTFCAKLGLEHLGSREPILFTNLGHPVRYFPENAFAAVFGILVTFYFWWKNTQGIHESSTKPVQIMIVTTIGGVAFSLVFFALFTYSAAGGEAASRESHESGSVPGLCQRTACDANPLGPPRQHSGRRPRPLAVMLR